MVSLQHEIQEAVDPERLFPENPEYHSDHYNRIMVAEDPILAVLKGAWADIVVLASCPSSRTCSSLTFALSVDRGCAKWKVERFSPVHAQSQVSLNQESCRLLLRTRTMMVRPSCFHFMTETAGSHSATTSMKNSQNSEMSSRVTRRRSTRQNWRSTNGGIMRAKSG